LATEELTNKGENILSLFYIIIKKYELPGQNKKKLFEALYYNFKINNSLW